MTIEIFSDEEKINPAELVGGSCVPTLNPEELATAAGLQRLIQVGRKLAAAATKLEPIKPIGRNEPCPCGSNCKFKKCCGKKGV